MSETRLRAGLRNLAAAAATLALAACLGGPAVPDQLLTLSPAQSVAAASPRTAGPGQTVTIAEPVVPQALATQRVPVYVNETAIQYLKDAQWVEYPSALFARLVGEVVAARTGRVVLDPAQFSQDPGTRVTGQLKKFGLDPTAMEAVIVYDAVMTNAAGNVSSNRFEARIPAADATPASVAPSLNAAANQIAEQVAGWIAANAAS